VSRDTWVKAQKALVVQQQTEGFDADVAFADVLVTIHPGVEFFFESFR